MPLSVSVVDDFIIFKNRVEELNDNIEIYKPPLEFINALKMIISDYNIKLPSHYNSKVIEANAQLAKLRKQVEERMNGLDSQIEENKKNIHTEIPSLIERVEEL